MGVAPRAGRQWHLAREQESVSTPQVVADTKEGDTGRLVEFLQDRDTPCPLCGYNVRNLTDNVCP